MRLVAAVVPADLLRAGHHHRLRRGWISEAGAVVCQPDGRASAAGSLQAQEGVGDAMRIDPIEGAAHQEGARWQVDDSHAADVLLERPLEGGRVIGPPITLRAIGGLHVHHPGIGWDVDRVGGRIGTTGTGVQ